MWLEPGNSSYFNKEDEKLFPWQKMLRWCCWAPGAIFCTWRCCTEKWWHHEDDDGEIDGDGWLMIMMLRYMCFLNVHMVLLLLFIIIFFILLLIMILYKLYITILLLLFFSRSSPSPWVRIEKMNPQQTSGSLTIQLWGLCLCAGCLLCV